MVVFKTQNIVGNLKVKGKKMVLMSIDMWKYWFKCHFQCENYAETIFLHINYEKNYRNFCWEIKEIMPLVGKYNKLQALNSFNLTNHV